jgi:hypothetical protein
MLRCAQLVDAPADWIAQGRVLMRVFNLPLPRDWQLTCCNNGLKVRPEGSTLVLETPGGIPRLTGAAARLTALARSW